MRFVAVPGFKVFLILHVKHKAEFNRLLDGSEQQEEQQQQWQQHSRVQAPA